MKSQPNYCSDIIAIPCRCAKFRLGKRNFGQHFVPGSEISCDISFGGAKFRATFDLAGRNSFLRFWTQQFYDTTFLSAFGKLYALRLVSVRLIFVTFAVTNNFFTSEQNTLISKSKS